jgi:hypothetical protein
LEWVEIYPVIFLLDDHAFPGYWRSLDAYYRFFEVASEEIDEVSVEDVAAAGDRTPRWVSGKSAYREIKRYVDDGALVPLESVLLTSASGFHEAVEAGRDYFASKRSRSFHSMVDIVSARESVTPLPLIFT